MMVILISQLLAVFQVDSLTDMSAVKQVIAKLETELHEKSTNVSYLEAEVRSLQRKLQMKDSEIARQDRELNKLKVITYAYYYDVVCDPLLLT